MMRYMCSVKFKQPISTLHVIQSCPLYTVQDTCHCKYGAHITVQRSSIITFDLLETLQFMAYCKC